MPQTNFKSHNTILNDFRFKFIHLSEEMKTKVVKNKTS